MSGRKLTRQSGLHSNTLCKLANNQNALLHLSVLETVCRVLESQPREVLHHVPGNEASTCHVRLLA